MAHIIDLQTFSENRGSITIIEKIIPFDIKRVFYIYDVDDSVRGKHRHKKTIQAAVAIKGTCTIYCNNNITEETFFLNDPSQCLILQPEDWHTMYDFSEDAVLLVLASENYDFNDYIFDPY